MNLLVTEPLPPVTCRVYPVPWRSMVRAAWLQRRAALLGLLALYVALALALVIGALGTHPTYVRYSGGTVVSGLSTDPFTALVIALNVLPVLVGVFVGAPLLSREFESGTFRFTWTQAIGRRRFVMMTLGLLAGLTTAGSCVLGLLLGWYAHPFETAGLESRWQSGLFDTTAVTLTACRLFALALGVFSAPS